MEGFSIEALPEKIACPHCGSMNCFEEGTHSEVSAAMIYSYLCMGCGYTSTSLNKQDNPMLAEYEEGTAEIIKELKWIDTATQLVWYQTVLNFPNSGIIFPEGTSKEAWQWVAAPAIDIPLAEQKRFPIPGTDQFYQRRVDMNQATRFAPTEFNVACKSIGLIKE